MFKQSRKLLAWVLSLAMVLTMTVTGSKINVYATEVDQLAVTATNCTVYWKDANGGSWNDSNKISNTTDTIPRPSNAGIEIKVMFDEGYQYESCLYDGASHELGGGAKMEYEASPNLSQWGGGESFLNGVDGSHTLVVTASRQERDPLPPGPGPEEESHTYTIRVNGVDYTNIKGNDTIKGDFDIENLEFWVTKVDDISLTNVGNKSTTVDSQGRNPLEIFTVSSTANSCTYNLTYHVEDDPANAEAPGFYLTNLTFMTQDYTGVQVMADSKPDMYDDTVFSDLADITATTASNPAVIPVYYGSSTVTLEGVDDANEVQSIKVADGFNPKAVSINQTTRQVKFNSPYYASIPLVVTLADGTVGYITIDRIGIALGSYRAGDTTLHGSQVGTAVSNASGAGASNIIATFYYSASESYRNYNMVANLTFADGTTDTVVVSGYGETLCIDPSLKGGDYLVWSGEASKSPVSVSVTAVKSGALSSSTFGGACFGSGKGVSAKFN